MSKRCHITEVTGKSAESIEQIASKFLDTFSPEHRVNPGSFDAISAIDPFLANHLGYVLDVVDDDHLKLGVLGATDFEHKMVVLPERTYHGCLEDDPEQRFTVCHELGHVLTIASEIGGRIKRLSNGGGLDKWELPRKRGDLPAYADPEWQADWCAYCLLMPRETFWKAMDNAIDKVVCLADGYVSDKALIKHVVNEMATTYQVTSYAVMYRWQKLLERGFGPDKYSPKQFKHPEKMRIFVS